MRLGSLSPHYYPLAGFRELDRAGEERAGVSPYFRHCNLHFGPVSICHCLVVPLPSQLPLLSTAAHECWGWELPSHPGVGTASCSASQEGLQLPQKTSVAVVGCQTQKTQDLIFCEACVRWEVCSEQWEVLAQSPAPAQL